MNETPTPTPTPVEVTITARDAKGATARRDFEYTPASPGVEEAVDDLMNGWIGRIDARIKDVQADT
jgi:hypothetical protein